MTYPHQRAAQEAANNTGRAQNILTSGVPGQNRMVEDAELPGWLATGFVVLGRAVPEPANDWKLANQLRDEQDRAERLSRQQGV